MISDDELASAWAEANIKSKINLLRIAIAGLFFFSAQVCHVSMKVEPKEA
tara:strand:- start:54 stop:203 length:150 start_codon:yes stop_codon:yes gene_type:complete